MGLFTYWKWPQNHCQNWFRADLLNIRLFDRFKVWGFFWPTCVGLLSPNRFWAALIQLGENFKNWNFFIFGILRPKVAFIRKFFPVSACMWFMKKNHLLKCKNHWDLKSQRTLSRNSFFGWLKLEYMLNLKLRYTPTSATQKMSCAKECVEISSPDDFYISGDGFFS